MTEKRTGLDTLIGLGTLGSAVIGVVGFVAALIAFFSGDLVGAGVCLIASALAFGLLANAVLRS
jgi:hypothetical protein